MSNIKVSPSILSANFSELGKELGFLTKAGADYIHLDVMDGHFVPNFTFGPVLIKSIRKSTDLPFDVHLMMDNPDNFIEEFAQAGSDIITVHSETTPHLHKTISHIKSLGKKAGVTFNPATKEDILDYIIGEIDWILVMTVNPGFGGQKFIESQLEKISNIRKKIDKSGRKITLEVDGGINEVTAEKAIKAGADVLVAGSFIMGAGQENYKKQIDKLKKL